MKQTVKVLILILIFILTILVGCRMEEYSENKEAGFDGDIIKEISLESESQTTLTGFKDELEDFKSFTDEFFPIWLDHINSASTMLDDFNSSTIYKERARNAEILEQRYLEFKGKLENIEPPPIALKAYNLAVEAVSYRALFFKMFYESAPVKELSEIENKAYLAEASFWEEIDNVYDYFDREIKRLKNEDDSIYDTASN